MFNNLFIFDKRRQNLKKQFILILGVLLSVGGVSQTNPYLSKSTKGNINTLDSTIGPIISGTGHINKRYFDTLSANSAARFKSYPGAQIYTSSDKKFWVSDGVKWIEIGGQTSSTCTYGLNSPGLVTFFAGLQFAVSSANYCIAGSNYTSRDTIISLPVADPSLPRQDVIAVNNNSQTVVISGTPSMTPAAPNINPNTQVYLTTILVPAGATSIPGATSTVIWDQNTGVPEYTGAASGVSASFINTTDPYHLTIATSIGAFTDGNAITYTGNTYSLNDYNAIRFFIKLKSAFSGATISVQLMNAGVPITLPYLVPASYSNTTSYQNISIPLSSFDYYLDLVGNPVNAVRFILNGVNSSGLYLDYITLNGGVSSGNSPYLTNVRRRAGTDTVEQQKNGVWEFAFIDSVSGGGSNSTLQNAFDNSLTAGDNPTINSHDNPLSIDSSGGFTVSGSGDHALLSGDEDLSTSIGARNGEFSYMRSSDAVGSLAEVRTSNADSSVTITSSGNKIFFVGTDSINTPQNSLWIDNDGRLRRAAPSAASGVTSVSANAPLSSSGGTTPIISADTSTLVTGLATRGKVRQDSLALAAAISLKQNLLTLTTTGTSGAATFNQTTGALNIPQYSGGGTTSNQSQLASGSASFTFTSVPASYSDYLIFRNGVQNNSVIDFTTAGNIITFNYTPDSGDLIVFQRIK